MNRPLVVESGPLRIEFRRQQDRFAHAIALVVGQRAVPLVSSCEGSADDHWPNSPPLPEIHIEDRPAGRRVALLVGMAGASHWSASIEARPEQRCVRFDVACRLHAPAGVIGSHYRLAAGVRAEEVAGAIELVAAPTDLLGGLRKIGTAPGDFRIASGHRVRLAVDTTDLESDVRLSHAAGRIAIEVRPSQAAQGRTVRWKYVISGPSS